MSLVNRIRAAGVASGIHFFSSCAMAVFASALVFLVWYPYPYRELSGGRELFLLVVSVDVICGPLLTLVLFNPAKRKADLLRDMTLVALIQLGALGYGLFTVWQARPLYLVLEFDRFKVITRPVLEAAELDQLPSVLRVRWWSGPLAVGIREPKNNEERERVMFESVQGGRDYAERPDFYLPYDGPTAAKSLRRAKPLEEFLKRQPDQRAAALDLVKGEAIKVSELSYLPVMARKHWVAIVDKQGSIKGFLPGDSF
ncbi:MAG: pilus assembly protein [Polaromonas sp.]|nr:pilus assembly protein [Polaromonas sp.]